MIRRAVDLIRFAVAIPYTLVRTARWYDRMVPPDDDWRDRWGDLRPVDIGLDQDVDGPTGRWDPATPPT